MDPFSAPPTTPMSVVIVEPPRKKRTGLFIAVAVVAVAAIAGGVFALTRGDDTETYSLSAAGDSAPQVRSMAFTMSMEYFGSEINADVEFDVEKQLMHMTMDLGGASGLDGAEMEMIIDLPNEMTYFNRSFFGDIEIPFDTEWFSMDAEFLAENGQDSIFDIDGFGSPLDVAAVTDSATNVVDMGFDEVEGLKVKRYQVTFKTADILVTNEALEGQLNSILELVGGEFPDAIVYDLYVDEQNQMRRVSYQMDVGSFEFKANMIVTSINEPVSFTVPDDDDVTDASEFL